MYLGIAATDVTTGQFQVTQLDDADAGEALTELYTFGPAEILPGPELRNDDEFSTACASGRTRR